MYFRVYQRVVHKVFIASLIINIFIPMYTFTNVLLSMSGDRRPSGTHRARWTAGTKGSNLNILNITTVLIESI